MVAGGGIDADRRATGQPAQEVDEMHGVVVQHARIAARPFQTEEAARQIAQPAELSPAIIRFNACAFGWKRK